MKTITKIIYPALALFALACFALPPEARAVCQDGCDGSNANTFLGDQALVNNTTGTSNTAIGDLALFSNTTSETNVAMGVQALYFNTTGNGNTGIGTSALHGNTTGDVNTGVGDASLYSNTIGNYNSASGGLCTREQHHWRREYCQRFSSSLATQPASIIRLAV